jgi:N-acetyl sugar amidotransferase
MAQETQNPAEYVECVRCVVDTTYPQISFDSRGVCAHCRDFDEKILPNWGFGHGKERDLSQLVAQIKRDGAGRDFDCIIGLSGGLDSSFMLHEMVHVHGLRPLVFHVDGGWNSDIAASNINALIDGLGLDLYTEVINWREMRDFQLACFRSGVPHIDIPQDHAFIGMLYRFAQKHGVKYIVNGGNYATEVVRRPLQYFYWGTDMWQINDIRARFGAKDMPTYPFSSIYNHKIYLRYFKGVRVVKPLNLMPYDHRAATDLLEAKYGWRRYPQKHFESRFTRFFEGFWLRERFGFDVRRVELSSLVLSGQLTRAEAVTRLAAPALSAHDIASEFKFVAAKLEISEEELRRYLDMPRRFYWDYRNQRSIFSLGSRVLAVLGLDRGGVS